MTFVVDALRMVDAFTTLFAPNRTVDGEVWEEALHDLWPEMLEGVNERCRLADGPSVASQDAPHLFAEQARQWAIELSGDIRDILHAAGVEIQSYVTV